MEIVDRHRKILDIFESVTGASDLTDDIRIRDIIQDSLSLMKMIVAIEDEFDIFLDDIDFIALYGFNIREFIHYAKIG